MKTIAVKEKTFELLHDLKKKSKADSFDELVLELIFERERVPNSMFGSLKGKTKSFTSEERKKIWADKNR